MNTSDTIAAIATPIGSGGIGVVRISGPSALDAAYRIFKPDPRKFGSHTAHHGVVSGPPSVPPSQGGKTAPVPDWQGGKNVPVPDNQGRKTAPVPNCQGGMQGGYEEIDDAVLTVFRAPRSYTGEDVVEISCHGGIATIKGVLRAALAAGARLAAPGEFTQRAFLNGKLDLSQAEAVNDLIRARTDQARKVALRQLDGALSSRVSGIGARVLGVIAAIEAAIDFPEDVDEPDEGWMRGEITGARDALQGLLASFGKGRIYREGLRVVIAGRVNVGKSSLMNALLRHARAIVTPIPGTTRDLIEESLEIQGIPIVAIDTAGLRATDDPVEQVGVDLSRQSIESADLILLVIDAGEGLHEEDAALLAELADRRVIVVANKIDLVSPSEAEGVGGRSRTVATSAATGQGIDNLEDAIAEIAGASDAAESVIVSNARHEEALRYAFESLGHALASLESRQPIDLLSGDLQAARNSLGLVTGETATEDLLDRIFSEFCIGK